MLIPSAFPTLRRTEFYVGPLLHRRLLGRRHFVVLQGVEVFAKVANSTFIIGTILPGVSPVLLLFGYWIAASGHPIAWQHLTDPAVAENGHARLWPAIHGLGTVAFLAGIVLLFAGVEVQAVFVTEMKNPRRYPAAIGLGALISLLIFALGAIPVAAILPYEKISLAIRKRSLRCIRGTVISDIWHMGWLNLVCCRCWLELVRSPACLPGLAARAEGCLRPYGMESCLYVLHATNAHGMPTHLSYWFRAWSLL